MKGKKKNCNLCGREFTGFGNNPNPLKIKGQVCDECNAYVIIPTRLLILQYTNNIKTRKE